MVAIIESAPVHRSADEPVAPDRLFVGLDGRDVSLAGDAWHVAVFGVCDEAGRRWVQLALEGSTSYMLTLCLAPGAGVPQALMALGSWLRSPTADLGSPVFG